MGPYLLVDLRTPEEKQEAAPLPHAIAVPVSLPIETANIRRAAQSIRRLAKGRPIVVYCARGRRSKAVAEALRQIGEQVEDAGGINDPNSRAGQLAHGNRIQNRAMGPLNNPSLTNAERKALQDLVDGLDEHTVGGATVGAWVEYVEIDGVRGEL